MTRLIDLASWERRRPIAMAFLAAIVGGVVGWTCVLAGLRFLGLIPGGAASVLVLVIASRRGPGSDLRAMIGFGFAFVLLTWTWLWIPVGYVWYLLTGQTLGS